MGSQNQCQCELTAMSHGRKLEVFYNITFISEKYVIYDHLPVNSNFQFSWQQYIFKKCGTLNFIIIIIFVFVFVLLIRAHCYIQIQVGSIVTSAGCPDVRFVKFLK